MTTAVDSRSSRSARALADKFYVYMAITCAVVAFIGFAPTYWMGLLKGGFPAHPVIHVHAIVFFAWALFLVMQTWLAASRQIASHRAMGLVAISLATLMTVLGVLAAISGMRTATALGLAEAGQAFAIVPIGSIAFFAVVFAAAVANVRRIEWHKRLMVVAGVSILDAPIARWFLVLLAPPGAVGPPPVAVDMGPSLIAFLILVAAMAFDWRTRGRPHPAYLIGGAAYVALKVLQVPVSETQAWHAISGFILGLAG